MTDAGFVVTAWAITALVVGGYAASLRSRIRKAERTLPPDHES